ncbi:tRNA (5-methylaminomethyl-2-thiouridine)(34)-methyltransferase MnmD [Daejeonella sp.]|uniref:tRNA (5-methylaminomethyl-2-thiouridine)(34)-methyltransferase MnmD n=1 Tax=Daejeonella sp. TaxID=2805397 RepID=UPI0039832A79
MYPLLSFAVTSDGSKTLFNSEVGEHYHSRHGAVQESKHVFLESGLKYFLPEEPEKVSILELGFGTGLNFLLSAEYCNSVKVELEYTGIEAYPLNSDLIYKTDYNHYVSPEVWNAFTLNYQRALKEEINLGSFCKLEIACTKLLEFQTTKLYDVLYFDAFAAIHQPEMWNEEALTHTSTFLRPGGVFVTYAITGNLKRTMKGLGFTIEKVPGAPGKREMLRAVKL